MYLRCLFGANLNNFNQQNLYDKLHVTHPYERETRLGLNLNFEWEVDFQRAPYFSRTDTPTENQAGKDWPISTYHLHFWNRIQVGSSIADTLSCGSWNGSVNLSLTSRLHLRKLNNPARLNHSKSHLLPCYVVLCIKRYRVLTNIYHIVSMCPVVSIWPPSMRLKWFQSHSRYSVIVGYHCQQQPSSQTLIKHTACIKG